MTEPLVFVHAADLHLDAPFRRVSAEDPAVRAACLEATFAAFERIVDVCLERDAAFLLIAGDAYNTADRSIRAQSRFRAAVDRLADAGIHTFAVCGNHDPATGWTAGLAMPEHVTYFSVDEVERIAYPSEEEPRCVLYGRSYARASETRNLAAGFRAKPDDPFSIGILHANVGGQPGYEPYAPCSLDDLRAARMDYWALGHIHKRMTLSEDPPVIYPGSPQGLDPNEIGEHGCIVVTVTDGEASTEFIETGQMVWDTVEVDLSQVGTIDEVMSHVESSCERARHDAAGRPSIVRVDLVGRTGVHAQLGRERVIDDLAEEIRTAQLARSPWVWLDRVRDLTRPEIDLEALRVGEGFASELVRIADEIARTGEDAQLLADALAPLHRQLDGVALDLDATDVLERARDMCLDHLLAGEDG